MIIVFFLLVFLASILYGILETLGFDSDSAFNITAFFVMISPAILYIVMCSLPATLSK